MEREYCLYKYVDRTTGVPVYVGQSQGRLAKGMGVEQRVRDHAKEHKFLPYLDNVDIVVTYLENPAEVNAYEMALINLYKPVLNIAMKYESISQATAKCFQDCFDWIPFADYMNKKQAQVQPRRKPRTVEIIEGDSYLDFLYYRIRKHESIEIRTAAEQRQYEFNLKTFIGLWECYQHILANGLKDYTKECIVPEGKHPDAIRPSIEIINHNTSNWISLIKSLTYDRTTHLLKYQFYENVIREERIQDVEELLFHIKQNILVWKRLLQQYSVSETFYNKTGYVLRSVPDCNIEDFIAPESDKLYEERAWKIA